MRKNIIVTIAAAALIIGAHYAGVTGFLEQWVTRVLAPVERGLFGAGEQLDQAYESRVNEPDYRALAERFREENERLLADNVKLQLLKEENRTLRQQLNFYSKHEYNKKFVNVIGRGDPLSNRQIITIDAGKEDGLQPGLPLVADDGVFVGKVFAVEAGIAHAYVLTDERCQVAAGISGRMETEGLVVGENGLASRFTLVPQDQPLEEGEVVVTSGLEPGVPAGLIIGTVQEVARESNDVFQSAVISPSVRLSDVNVLSVVLP